MDKHDRRDHPDDGPNERTDRLPHLTSGLPVHQPSDSPSNRHAADERIHDCKTESETLGVGAAGGVIRLFRMRGPFVIPLWRRRQPGRFESLSDRLIALLIHDGSLRYAAPDSAGSRLFSVPISAVLFIAIAHQSHTVQLATREGEPGLLVRSSLAPLSSPVKAPKYGWEFGFAVEGLVKPSPNEPERLRFRVYAETADRLPLAQGAARTLLRLWSQASTRLGLDHRRTHKQLVELFLSAGGKAGGEQFVRTEFAADGAAVERNAIFIYEVNSFDRPIEMLREIAHEYGHAVLPAIGGFQYPEEWGNGFAGEKLFLTWLALRDDLAPEDAMGATKAQIEAWVTGHAQPLADKIWLNGIDTRALASTGQPALNEYIGLMLYASEAFPQLLSRAIRLTRSQDAVGVERGLRSSIEEVVSLSVNVPPRHSGRTVWLPIGIGWKVQGGMRSERRGDWASVKPDGQTLTLTRAS